MNLNKPSNNGTWLAIITAIITILLGLVFMGTSINQEINVRNIEEIPKLINRIDRIERDSDRYRDYLVDFFYQLKSNEADIKAIGSKQEDFRDKLAIFEQRVYEMLIKEDRI